MIFVDVFIKRKCQSNGCCITEVRGGLLPLAVGCHASQWGGSWRWLYHVIPPQIPPQMLYSSTDTLDILKKILWHLTWLYLAVVHRFYPTQKCGLYFTKHTGAKECCHGADAALHKNDRRNSESKLWQKINLIDIWHFTFYIWYLTFDIQHSTFNIWLFWHQLHSYCLSDFEWLL